MASMAGRLKAPIPHLRIDEKIMIEAPLPQPALKKDLTVDIEFLK